jgi:hypothetical protein
MCFEGYRVACYMKKRFHDAGCAKAVSFRRSVSHNKLYRFFCAEKPVPVRNPIIIVHLSWKLFGDRSGTPIAQLWAISGGERFDEILLIASPSVDPEPIFCYRHTAKIATRDRGIYSWWL